MRILKIIGLGIGGLLLLLVIAVVAVSVLVNPNDYKDRITRQVRTATGRELALPGDLKLSVFPWIALEIGPATLGNPASFHGGEFLKVQHAALRVRLLPLLHKELQIGKIEIDQLELNLQKNADGKGNWEDFGEQNAAPAPGSSTGAGQSASMFSSLEGIAITKSHLTYGTLNISDLNLDIGNVAQKASVPVSLSLNLDPSANAATTSVAATFKVSLDMGAKQYGLADVNLTGEQKSKTGAPPVAFKFSAASMIVDMGAQTLRAAAMAAQFADAKVSGSLNGNQIMDKPVFSGSLQLEPLALRAFLSEMGTDLPKTRDAQAFGRLSFKSDFQYGDNSVKLANLQAQLDDSSLHGSLAITNLDTKATTFELALDRIDIDRYRSPVEKGPPPPQPDGKPAPLPTDALKPLDVNGRFTIRSAKFSGLTLSDVSLSMLARGGLLHLAPLTAKAYGGTYTGDVTYDVRGAAPALQLTQQLTAVDMAPLLKDAANSQRLSGHGNASMALSGHGIDSDAIMRSLTGKMALNLTDGAIEGADLAYDISVAEALLKQQSMPAGPDTKRTKFDALKMSADITDGVAKTNDLTIGTPFLRITGQGTTSLVTTALDLHLVATVLKAPPSATGADLSQLTLAEIPVTINGTASDPKVRPDLQGILKSQLQQKAKDLIKGKLNDQLKGIFGTH